MRAVYIFLSVLFLSLTGSSGLAQEDFLGIPVFPGAEETETVEALQEEVDLGVKIYKAAASFEEVVEFYRHNLPKAMFSSVEEEGEKSAMFQLVENEETKVVTIMQAEGEDVTEITVMKQY